MKTELTDHSNDLLPPALPEDIEMSSERLAFLNSTLETHVREGRLPGAVMAIVRKGKLVYHEAVGFRDKAADVPMTLDSLFWTASMTKPVTVVAALHLYEQGKLMLGDPVGKYLPAFADMQVGQVITDSSGQESIERVPAHSQPTILDLMRHTSGMVEGMLGSTPVHRLYEEAFGDGMFTVTGAEFLERMSQLPLLHQPETVWHYGFGLDVLGLIIESISGQSLGDYMQKHIFQPLGMKDTYFGIPAGQEARYAQPLSHDPLTGQPQHLPDLSLGKFHSGGAGLVSTASDYARFAAMLVGRGTLDNQRILSSKSVEYMTADQLAPDVDDSRLSDGDPVFIGYGFGLGVAVRRATGITPSLGSKGDFSWSGAGGTYWWGDPQEELAVVFMAHIPTRATSHFYRQFIRALVLSAIME